jgi:hypothetical protein
MDSSMYSSLGYSIFFDGQYFPINALGEQIGTHGVETEEEAKIICIDHFNDLIEKLGGVKI